MGRGTVRGFIASAGMAATIIGAPGTVRAAAETWSVAPTGPGVVERLPDMKMARLYALDLEWRPNGRVRLHFGTIGWNVGTGPLEARGRKVDPTDPYMQVRQRIYRSDGSFRSRTTPAILFFAGDNHIHWHVRQFMTVQLYRPGEGTGHVYGLRKLGYCLLDARRMINPPPGSPTSGVYPADACGDEDDTHVRMGLSVGWGDDYPPYFAHQWMDVTGLPAGDYRLCSTVDPLDDFLESNDANNQRWTDVHIDIAADEVTVLGTANGACGPSVP